MLESKEEKITKASKSIIEQREYEIYSEKD